MKVILLFVLLVQGVVTFSQAPTPTKDEYLTKSKNKKKVANILLLSGSALVTTAFIFPKGKANPPSNGAILYFVTYKNDGIKGGMFIAGVAAMLSSIPFYLGSSKNKRKARAMTLNINNTDLLIPRSSTLVFRRQTGVTLKLAL